MSEETKVKYETPRIIRFSEMECAYGLICLFGSGPLSACSVGAGETIQCAVGAVPII